MKTHRFIFSLAALLLTALPRIAAADVPVAQNSHGELNVGGMAQLLGFGQHLDDAVKNDNRVYLFLKEARLRLNGKYDDYSVNMELALGGEETVAAPSPGVALTLLDLSLNIPLHVFGDSYVKVGQFKVPYGRARLTYSGSSDFVDRSVMDPGFKVGRDVGIALVLRPGPLTVIGGVFTGGGRDAPIRFIPQTLGVPMLALRAGVGNVDEDPFALKATDFDPQTVKSAFFVNAIYTKDSLIGHSSVLNVKLADKSLVLDPAWNPFIAKAPFDQGAYWQVGADAALRMPVAGWAISAEAEFNWAGFVNTYGIIHMAGGRASVAAYRNGFEAALRYAFLIPDAGQAAANGTPITGNRDPIHEITPALTWYINGNHLKLVGDLPLLFNAPIFNEAGVGSYVATEVPQESSVLAKAGSFVAPQTVIEARLMLQGQF